MPLVECQDCKKQISDQAPACPNCGRPGQKIVLEIDNSNLKRFAGHIKNQNSHYKYIVCFGNDESQVMFDVLNNNPGYMIDNKEGIKEAPIAYGKYSCPNCKAKFTSCQKNIGCAIIFMIIISLGLGLIMVPFLPYRCLCNVCNYHWKS